MTKSFAVLLIITSASLINAQSPSPGQERPRVVVTNTMPAKEVKAPTPRPTPAKIGDSTPDRPAAQTTGVPAASDRSHASNLSYNSLSFSQIKSRIAEAKRQMQSRPLMTSLTEPMSMLTPVRIAYYDWDEKKVEYVVLSKEAFLTPNTPTTVFSSNGKPMTSRTIRANGVNTPVELRDAGGQAHLPLMIQYPVERGGKYYETAYYMSTDPGLVTPETVPAGRLYVRHVIDISRARW